MSIEPGEPAALALGGQFADMQNAFQAFESQFDRKRLAKAI
jgi:hypothetical protein